MEVNEQIKQLEDLYDMMEYEPLSIKDVLKMKFSKYPFLVENLIPERGITVISGQPGCGKSWVALHIAQCMTSKKKVFDKFKTKRGSVFLVDGETGLVEVQRRLKKMKFRADKKIFISSEENFKLDAGKGLKRILGAVKKNKIALVILDPLIALHSGDENVARDMQKVMDAVKKITYEGAAVLIIHHHKKNEDGNSPSQYMRGSSAIHGAIDSHIEVKGENNELEILQVGQYKARRGKAEKPFIVKIEENNGLMFKFVEYIQRPLNGTQEIKEQIMAILDLETGKDLKLIHSAINQSIKMGVGENRVRTALKELEALGKVKATRSGHNTFIYRKA